MSWIGRNQNSDPLGVRECRGNDVQNVGGAVTKHVSNTSNVSPWMSEAFDEARPDRVVAGAMMTGIVVGEFARAKLIAAKEPAVSRSSRPNH
jgi:hypothetical protein